MVHLIKSVEEDSQDINDYVQLGFFLESQDQRLDDLYLYDWEHPAHIPDNEAARRAFVKISLFFHRLKESLVIDPARGCLVFNSGDGVDVDVAEIKARLKSPESMVIKLGKDVEGEAYDIRDILAITFILKSMDDTLKLFHALQKRGVILQENTASHSVTQTLFDGPESMREAVRRLMISLSGAGEAMSCRTSPACWPRRGPSMRRWAGTRRRMSILRKGTGSSSARSPFPCRSTAPKARTRY